MQPDSAINSWKDGAPSDFQLLRMIYLQIIKLDSILVSMSALIPNTNSLD